MKRALLITAVILLVPQLALAQEGGGLAEYGAYSSNKFANGMFVDAICDLFGLVGGSFGAMLTTAALVTGLIAASVGGFSEVRGAVMVAVSCFAITACVSLYFGSFTCGAGTGGGGNGAPANGPDPFGDE